MAYAHPHFGGRSPPDPAHEAPRPQWPSTYNHRPPPYGTPNVHSSVSNFAPSDAMDHESSDSDVSVGIDDRNRGGSPVATPVQLPPPPPKHILESTDNVQTRLREISSVEDHNLRKQDTLRAKRRRKDDKIARKRELQDRKIKAIYDARERRDARINTRRAREDAAFRAVDDQIEEEETSLRRRLKRLKRGLPLDESTQLGRGTSTTSMSPPGPAFSTIPPPAKRHQSGRPGQFDGVPAYQSGSHPPPPPPNPPSAPSYSFYQSNPKPYAVPYQVGPTYSTVPPPPPPHSAQASHPAPPTSQHDRSPYVVNGRPASPGPRTSYPNPVPSHHTPPSTTPARQTSTTYDTRPPPTTSGFASINVPTTSGFAAVNARAAATPPVANSSMEKTSEIERTRTPVGGANQPPPLTHSSSSDAKNGTPASNEAGATPAGGKRTPSTTHPYQMSEAFANRHHHCERVDSLNRGIWTAFGPGGTQDRPTGPAEEMYLRCNHDDCRRIDWRTVHGLQCHIVKNHEQPKGTIGSLEKALDRYGVPIREVEEYEREHGEGTGGTIADPKNLKIKNKTKEAINRKSTPGSYGIDPTARPAGYKPNPPGLRDSPTVPSSMHRSSSGSVIRRNYVQDESTYSDSDEPISLNDEVQQLRKNAAGGIMKAAHPSKPPWEGTPFRPTANTYSGSPLGGSKKTEPAPRKSGPPFMSDRYEAVNVDWHTGTRHVTGPPAAVDPNRQLQGDAVMKDAPPMSTWKHWSPARHAPESVPSSTTISAPESSQTIPKNTATRPQIPTPTVIAAPATQNGLPSTQTQAMAEEVKKIEQRQEEADSTFATPQATESQNTDTQMIAVSDSQPSVPASQNSLVDGKMQKMKEDEQPRGAVTEASSRPNEADGEHNQEKAGEKKVDLEVPPTPTMIEGPARGTRSALQSPIQTNKPLNTPLSAKRLSRRSSTARKLSGDSEDGYIEMAKNADGVGGEKKHGEKDKDTELDMDGDSITVATSVSEMKKEKADAMKETSKDREAKTPPKRNANGRFTRKRTLG